MSPVEQQEALMDLKHKKANLDYTAATGLKCESHMEALRLPYLDMRQYLIQQAGMPWDGDLVNLRAALIGVHSKWDALVGERACPISFTDEEVRSAMQESREWNEAAEVLTTIRDTLGIDGEGGTDPDKLQSCCRSQQGMEDPNAQRSKGGGEGPKLADMAIQGRW